MEVFNCHMLAALTFAAIVFCHAKPPAPEDIGTNFFLKASKSVPRIGRRTVDYENYFLKASKSIPRIGRRTVTSDTENNNSWMPQPYQEPVKKSFFEKYFKGSEQPVWSDLEKIYQDYPENFQPEGSYSDPGNNPESEPYWSRTKKDKESVENQS